ncbi:MAG: FAD-dependent oxidoreductase [Desulfomonilaceae bacterium]|nr:FAD-dependent oxidoreductase [Desulfomonilaceae bacterium]
MTDMTYDVAIIGAGPAGLTSALYSHRAGYNIILIGGDTPGGQVIRHYRVDNYPGFPGGITGAELMTSWIKQLMDETGSVPVPESVSGVDFSADTKRLVCGSAHYAARAVIVATGARPRRLGVPGEDKPAGNGVFYCATCDAPLLRTMKRRRAAVVGGGDSAFHTALALLPHADTVTVVSRSHEVRAKPVLVDRFMKDPKAQILTARSVKAVMGRRNVSGLTLVNVNTNEEITMPLEAVFIGIGQAPVTDFLAGALTTDREGFIVTGGNLNTSVPGVFAAGDVRVSPLRQIITAAADGALAAQSAAQYLRTSAVHASSL